VVRSAFHVVIAAGVILLSVARLDAQPLGRKLAAAQHVSVETSASAPAATPGKPLTLWVDVTPAPRVHVYAEGANAFDFTPVSIVLTPHAAVSAGKPRFPPSQPAPAGGADEKAPIYDKAFRITQPITLRPSAKRGAVVTISGVVNYQACDDRLCYPPASIPVQWTLTVR
jgi:hypothetical protein